MASLTRVDQLGAVLRLQNGTQILSRYRTKILEHSKPLFTLGMLGLSGVLALLAHSLSASHARDAWEYANPPPNELWGHSLSAFGLTQVLDEHQFLTLTRDLNIEPDRHYAVALTQNMDCIALFPNRNESLPSALYCDTDLLKKKSTPVLPNWTLAGYGWNGYQTAISTLKSQKTLKLKPLPTAPTRRLDPREIRY